jgi:O-Antigen ligase
VTLPAELALGLAFAVLGAAAIGYLSRAPELLHYAIGASAALEGAEIAKIHVFVLLCFLSALLELGRRPLTFRLARTALYAVATLSLVLTAFIGPLVNHRALALQILSLAASGIYVMRLSDSDTKSRMLTGFVAMCCLASLDAIGEKLGFFSYTDAVDPPGFQRVHAFYHEPDWLGMYCAAGLVLVLFARWESRRLQAAVGISLLTGLVLSEARAAWLALGIVVVVALVILRRQDLYRNSRLLAVGAAGAIVVAVAFPSVLNSVVTRIESQGINGVNQVSVTARQEQMASLSAMARTAPWYGDGLSASGDVEITGGTSQLSGDTNNVATDWFLGWWVDGKFLAIPLIALFIGAAVLASYGPTGLLLGVVLVSSLFSNAMVEPIAWFGLGLALADARFPVLRRRSGPRNSAVSLPIDGGGVVAIRGIVSLRADGSMSRRRDTPTLATLTSRRIDKERLDD